MKHIFLKCHQAIYTLPTAQFILLLSTIAFLGKIIPTFIVWEILTLFSPNSSLGGYNANTADWKAGLIVAPILETLVFQAAPVLILKKYTQLKSRHLILISALLFAAVHFYSVAFIVLAFVLGLCFAYSYVVYLNKTSSAVTAFFVTCSIHSLHNLMGYVVSII